MKSTFDVRSIEIATSPRAAFEFISNPANLPLYTYAYKKIEGERALMMTPTGEMWIRLVFTTDAERGTIDIRQLFPDGSEARAFTRVVPSQNGGAIYSFLLLAPPPALEKLEGPLENQMKILEEELSKIKSLLEVRK